MNFGSRIEEALSEAAKLEFGDEVSGDGETPASIFEVKITDGPGTGDPSAGEDDAETAPAFIRELMAQAGAGDGNAQYLLACYYLKGEGVRLDLGKCLEWLEKAAKGNNPDAIIALTELYSVGLGVKRDEKGNFLNGSKTTGLDYPDSDKLEKPPDESEKPAAPRKDVRDYHKKSAESMSPFSLLKLGFCHLVGKGVNKNEKLARILIRKSLTQGASEANLLLALFRAIDRGETLSKDGALKLFNETQDLDETDAKFRLALCHIEGRGTEVDKELGLRLLAEAARKCHSEAIFTLGTFHLEGKELPQNTEEAIKLFREAAGLYHPPAFEALSRLYHEGVHVPEDLTDLIALITRGTKLNIAWCQFTLGVCYREGKVVNKNNAMAFRLVEKACLRGLKEAREKLAEFYETGVGVPVDKNKARELLESDGRLETGR
ncbi:MAG: sel1 repeat family protein [Deltaproteobacteria bacterium]|jgi:TPR repeat protein|nr:sel1 repeat family protein [Deltaproteobacteria bacterium]